MTLGQNIQNARRAQGLSQEALAEKIGVSRQALGKWEKDTALPGLDNLQALAAALGIGVDALLGAENADPAVPAVTLCLASLADGGLSAVLFNGGAALTLTGFLLQHLAVLGRRGDAQ